MSYKVTPNRVAISLTNSSFWGQSSTIPMSVEKGVYALLNEARFVLSLSWTITGGTPALTITRPPIAWINTANTTIEYETGNGQTVTENYSTQSNRGDVGYLLELMDLSYSGWEDANALENLTVPYTPPGNTAATGKFEVCIPFRYIIDPCISKKYLPIKTFVFQPNWRSLLDVMAPSAVAGVTGFTVTVNSFYVDYNTVEILPSPSAELKLPDLRGIYILPLNRVAGDTQTSVTIAIPGKPRYLYHFFLSSGTNPGAGGTNSTYLFNTLSGTAGAGATTQSIITYQQCSIGGKTFPLNPQYGSTAVDDVNAYTGLSHLYHEWQVQTNNFMSGNDTRLTFADYRDKTKIYAIDLSAVDTDYATFQFNAQYSPLKLPTNTTSMSHIIFVIYAIK